jgi:hypothetical protein
MGSLFANIASSQETVTRLLIVGGLVLIAFAGLTYWRRGRTISVRLLPRSLIAPIAAIVIAVVLALGFVTEGPEIKLLLQQSHPSLASFLDSIGTMELGGFKMPNLAAQTDAPLRRSLTELACALKLQEGSVKVSAMDSCISFGTEQPDDVYTYITGEGLGAKWVDLSVNEKQIALSKAKADAATDAQLIPLAKSLGVPFGNLRHANQ